MGAGEGALQRQNTKFSKQIFPEKEYRGLSPNIHIHASVIDLYIPTIGLPILMKEILEIYESLTDMNVEIGAEAALFPEKEYIRGIFVAVWEIGRKDGNRDRRKRKQRGMWEKDGKRIGEKEEERDKNGKGIREKEEKRDVREEW